MALGGNTSATYQTSLAESDSGAKRSGWAVAGLGLTSGSDGLDSRIMGHDEWVDIFKRPPLLSALRQLDGHFVLITWDPEKLHLYSDALGLRTCYLRQAPSGGGYWFATRLDWLSQLENGGRLNLEAFGSHWLTFNQMNQHSLLKDIDRLPSGGHAELSPTELIRLDHVPWRPKQYSHRGTINDYNQTIRNLIAPATNTGKPFSLGLSGGLDSRALLGVAMKAGIEFSAHVLGEDNDPDVKVAHKIASKEQLELAHFHHKSIESTSLDQLISDLYEYAAHTAAQTYASHSIKVGQLSLLHRDKELFIDGGFGEIARRKLFNRLAIKGKKLIYEIEDFEDLYPYFKYERPGFFTSHTRELMYEGSLKSIKNQLLSMPPVQKIGIDNFVDLLAIQTRIPNTYGREQARIDGAIPHYMPFIQPSFLRLVFNTSPKKRFNSKLFKKLIKMNRRSLSRHPLVQNGAYYSFSIPSIAAQHWTLFKNKLGLRYKNRTRKAYLDKMKPFVMDTIGSQSFKNFPLYDHQRISDIAEKFYAGEQSYAMWLDWWLSFEAWRQKCGITG